MKNLYVIILLCISNLIVGQAYVPMPIDSATWVNNVTCWTPCNLQTDHQPTQVVLRGDSIINGLPYHKLYSIGTNSQGYLFCFYREANKKVYFKYPVGGYTFGADTAEFVLYDFNLIIGDTFAIKTPTTGMNPLPANTVKIKLVSITSVSLTAANKMCTAYNFTNVSAGFPLNLNIVWYEGIAANQGLLYNLAYAVWPITSPSAFPYMYDLSCFYRSNSFSYNPSCSITSINEPLGEINKILIFPNPTNSLLTLQIDEEITSLAIYNTIGEACNYKPLDAKRIDISGLSSGVYYLELKTTKGLAHKKFVKE